MFAFSRSIIRTTPSVALLVLLWPGAAGAADPLRREMKVVAEKLRDVFARKKIKEIAALRWSRPSPTRAVRRGPESAGCREAGR